MAPSSIWMRRLTDDKGKVSLQDIAGRPADANFQEERYLLSEQYEQQDGPVWSGLLTRTIGSPMGIALGSWTNPTTI